MNKICTCDVFRCQQSYFCWRAQLLISFLAIRMATQESESPYIRKNEPVCEQLPAIRSGFITKVYGILSVQLVLTAVVATPFVLSAGVQKFVQANPSILYLVGFCNILFLFCMTCPCGCQQNMRKYPQNYLLLAGFTATEGVLVGVICSLYTLSSVVFAVLATAFLVLALTFYAMTTKSDFTGMGGYLFTGLIVLFIFGIFTMFLHIPMMHSIYCCLGIFLFSCYLIYDTQMIMGNKELAIGIDDYVFAALQLYLDIIQLFIYILQLFGDKK